MKLDNPKRKPGENKYQGIKNAEKDEPERRRREEWGT